MSSSSLFIIYSLYTYLSITPYAFCSFLRKWKTRKYQGKYRNMSPVNWSLLIRAVVPFAWHFEMVKWLGLSMVVIPQCFGVWLISIFQRWRRRPRTSREHTATWNCGGETNFPNNNNRTRVRKNKMIKWWRSYSPIMKRRLSKYVKREGCNFNVTISHRSKSASKLGTNLFPLSS